MDKAKGRVALRVPARASLWYIASSAVARSVSVVGTPIFTRLLDAEEYGIFPHYMAYFSVLSVIATLELTGAVILPGLQKFEHKRERVLSSAIGLTGAVWAAIFILYFTFSAIFGNFTGLSDEMMVTMLLHILLNAIISIYTAQARFLYRYKTVALTNLLTALMTPLLSILLITRFGTGGVGRIYGAVISTALLALPFLFIIFKRSPAIYDGEIWRFLLRFNLPLLPHYIASSVIIRAGEVALSHTHGTVALAKYSVSMSVGLSLTVITNGILSALSPWMLRRVGRGEFKESRELLTGAVKLLCGVCLIILAIVPETIKIVSPPEYHDCLFAVYPLALSVIPSFLTSAITAGEGYYERSGATSIPTVIAAVVTVVLTVLLAPFIDYRLIALFVPVAYTLTCVLNTLLFKRLSGELPIEPHKCVLFYLFTVIYAGGIFMLRESLALRLLAVVPILFPLFSEGKRIYAKIKEA